MAMLLCTAFGAMVDEVHVQAAATRSLLGARITPELEPVSDKKFFKSDYPDDRRAPQFHKFGYPYPTVQDTDEYDKDYVKDENNDNGYWKAQMRYDMLKNKLMKERDDLAKVLAKELKEKKELEKQRAEEAAKEKGAKDAEAAEALASDKDKAAGEHLDATMDQVGDQTDEVDKEIDDLEECKRQLAAVRKQLKDLLAEKAAAEKASADAAKNEDDAESAEVSAEKNEADLEKSVAQEEAEHEAALIAYKKELEDVKKATADLEKAAEKLRKYRRADPDGGVYEVGAHSAAMRFQGLWAGVVLACVMAALLM